MLLFSVCLCQEAAGQGTSPVVATGPISAVASHPATWGQVWQTAISSKGDLVVYDFEHGALYEFPAGGGAMITLAGPGLAGPGGGWANCCVAIDPWDNLGSGSKLEPELIRIPYDAVNHSSSLASPTQCLPQYTSAPESLRYPLDPSPHTSPIHPAAADNPSSNSPLKPNIPLLSA